MIKLIITKELDNEWIKEFTGYEKVEEEIINTIRSDIEDFLDGAVWTIEGLSDLSGPSL